MGRLSALLLLAACGLGVLPVASYAVANDLAAHVVSDVTPLATSTTTSSSSTSTSTSTSTTTSTTMPTSPTLAASDLGYTPLSTPVRIADTRSGATDPSTYAGKTLSEGNSLLVDIPSSAGVPSTAGAVVVNITAISPVAAGFLAVYPGGASNPGTANITFKAGQTVGNLATVGLGPDSATSATQSFAVYDGPSSNGGNVDFTADLEGYYAPQTSSSGAAYVGITPTRIYDSRGGSGQTGAGTTLTGGGSDNVTVTGVASVPSTASAVVLNVALTNATAGSSAAPNFIYAYPTGSTPSTPVANQTYVAGETLSSEVIAGIGTGGAVTIANHTGNVDIVVDVDGYFTQAGGAGSLFDALAAPQRLLDTRPQTVAGGATTSVTVQGTGATAGVLNVTDIYDGTSGGNFLTDYPTGATAPTAATVNFVSGDTYNIVPNASYATVGTSAGVTIANGPSNAGPAAVVVDEFGYFAPPAAGSLTVTPSGAQTPVVSTSASSTNGDVSYTASGIPSGDTVSLALFPATATDAPTVTNGTLTFTPTTAGTAGPAAGQGTTDNGARGNGAFVQTLNGANLGSNTAGNTHTGAPGVNGKMTNIAPSASTGDVTFTVNSFVADGTIPVVWTEPSGATADTLMVNGDGTPQSGFSVGVGGSAIYSLYGVFPVTPSTAQTPTVSVAPKTKTAGNVNYTVSGIPSGDTVSLALFPATGADAPVVSNGTITFAPTTAGTAGPAAGQGTTDNGAGGLGGFVETLNGASLGANTTGNAHTGAPGVNGQMTNITPTSGQVVFTINSFIADGTIPVVWFEPSNATADTLLVTASGSPQAGFAVGVGASTTWSAAS